MTLTLDEVRNTKFHMARRAGYEVTDVDLFVDRVEASFAQLVEENQMLKRQIEALKSSQGDAPLSDEDGADDTVRQQPPAKQQAPAAAAPAPEAAAPAEDEDEDGTSVTVGTGPQQVVVRTPADASPWAAKIVQNAAEDAERWMAEAAAGAKETVESARREAHEITTDARTKAERVESEARVNAERLRNEAAAKASEVDRQVEERRSTLFTQLEQQRDGLQAAVRELADFEAEYRRSFTTQLEEQLSALKNGSSRPASTPALLEDEGDEQTPAGRRGHDQSSTPRLDALIRDNG
ncbi:DivIVA domain-containing protein [Auraticoccus monumenti]|uniref:Cell wall synthesis protein Wag31 n=1 Tax=Auraticoccus monumenti TaxID=675864 RepID=A0A1G7DLE4_9ACTN|nr:DivIVA domain-containing protein [Auraticoccus monumenti]SDE52339.1 DivIVA domain-containing protein [Auraticoccus monumenti]